MTLTERAAAFLRTTAAASLAGVVAGIIAGGVGGRIAMRVTALTAGDADQGRLTDADEAVGVISLEGTLGLILFVGISTGMLGGILYAGARPWLGRAGSWRGALFGCVLLAALGWMVIERDNFDFHEFGYATLNIAMFAGLFIAFGLIVAPLHDWLAARLPDVRLTLAGAGGLAARAFGMIGLVGAAGIAIGAGSDIGGSWGFIPIVLVAVSVLAIGTLSAAGGGVRHPADAVSTVAPSAIMHGTLAAPVVAGAVLGVRAVIHHLTVG